MVVDEMGVVRRRGAVTQAGGPRSRRTGARTRVAGLALLTGTVAASMALIVRPAPAAATKSIAISDSPSNLLNVLLPRQCQDGAEANFCFTPKASTAATGEVVVWVNNSSTTQHVTGHGASTPDAVDLSLGVGQSGSTSFPVADRVSYNVGGGEGGTIDVTGPPVTTSNPGQPGSSGGAHPGAITAPSGAPKVVAAPTVKPHFAVAGAQGSSALPPVDAADPGASAASPAPDLGALPPISLPSPSPKAAVLATSTTNSFLNRLGQRQTLYIAGGALFVLVVVISTVVWAVRRRNLRKSGAILL